MTETNISHHAAHAGTHDATAPDIVTHDAATHDAIVIGAGVAGGATAIELAGAGLRVAVVEKAEFPRRKVCGEFMSAATVPVLERLGVADAWERLAGPEVARMSLFVGDRVVEAPMPLGSTPLGRARRTGRALGRDVLDGLLLDRAAALGADVRQPTKAVRMDKRDGLHAVTVSRKGEADADLTAPLLIAAHGSWEPGPLPTQSEKRNAPHDLLGFKAHFTGAALPAGEMPLLAFPGGYGGMVWADRGRLSVSCCIRRDVLTRVREREGLSAGEAMQHHLVTTMKGAATVLESAALDGPWLATGAIRPGIRTGYADDVFRVGNVAGESHPIIAEGQSMAIQSTRLLAEALAGVDWRREDGRVLAGAAYSRAWRRQFATRIRAASVYSHLAMRADVTAPLAALIAAAPRTLTWGAALSGKTKPVRAV